MTTLAQVHRLTIEASISEGDYDSEYAEYIMEHADGSERIICNGDTLIKAMEDGYLYDDFVEYMVEKLA